MQQIHDQRNKKEPLLTLISRSTLSFLLVLLTQFTLSLVPLFFSASSLLLQFPLSVVVLLFVLGFGRWCKRLLGVYASAPAFVFFSILFIWAVYFFIVRQAVPHFIDVVFNGEVVMLFIGLWSILSSDPSFVTYGSSYSDKLDETKAFEVEAHNEGSLLLQRVRYCKSCKAYVKGFDHHCPAFGNCIGQNNHVLFMVLLLGFLSTEASYIMCSFQFARGSHILGGPRFEIGLAGSLVISTMLFTLLQVLWQGIFMVWHIYCICFNIRTDEWINWKKYPEFQVIIQSQSGGSFTQMRFTNPYDKGISSYRMEETGVEFRLNLLIQDLAITESNECLVKLCHGSLALLNQNIYWLCEVNILLRTSFVLLFIEKKKKSSHKFLLQNHKHTISLTHLFEYA